MNSTPDERKLPPSLDAVQTARAMRKRGERGDSQGEEALRRRLQKMLKEISDERTAGNYTQREKDAIERAVADILAGQF